MKASLSKLDRSGRGFAFILSGTVMGQLITLAALPFLSRIYDPAAFGVFSFVLGVTALVTPIAGLRLESAAMLPTQHVEVRALARNCVLSIVLFTITSGTVIEILRLFEVAFVQDVPLLGLWVASLVFLTSLFSLLTQLALRRQRYISVATRNLYQSAAAVAGQLLMSFFTRNAPGLLAGQILGRTAGIVPLWFQTKEDFAPVDREARKLVWRRYWRFPAVFAPSALLNAMGTQAPVLFIVFWFGVQSGGQVGMAERIVGIPLALIGAAAAQVLEAEVSIKIRDGVRHLRGMYLRLTGLLSILGLGAIAGFGLLGGWLIPIVLGPEWGIAGLAVQIMAVNAGIRLVASPLSKFILLYQRSLANTLLDITRVVLMAAAFVITIVCELSLVWSLIYIYTSLAITYLLTWAYGFRITGKNRD